MLFCYTIILQAGGSPLFLEKVRGIMAIEVSLREVVGVLQMVSNDTRAYLNKVTGELIALNVAELDLMEMGELEDAEDGPDWQREYYQKLEEVVSSEDYLMLPDNFEIHEYQIMQGFCYTIPDENTSGLFLDMLHGSGAFRRFKNLIYRYGIEKDWFAYKNQAFKEIAIAWLEREGIAYRDDMEKEQRE